ncbi:GNAT family N-acetyltransferase [Peribacillus kribbensis]|uniref:GNAT family N-acetyltransferase n=1 Tax=Peribacillus kribbensis TaxID=356658 RepID=UPI00042A4679|nr:GNAT family protein [Peribacillus kribbensis]
MFNCQVDEDIQLRLFTLGDAEELFQLTCRSKPYLKEWLGWLDYTVTKDDSAEFIKGTLSGTAETGGHPKSAAIVYRGKIAGTIGFNEINRMSKIGVIGYWLGEEFQGRGIMSRSFKAFVDYGFKEAGLNRIEVRAAVGNLKSRALPEHLHFKEEGLIREAEWLYDHYVDHVVYGLLRREWESQL